MFCVLIRIASIWMSTRNTFLYRNNGKLSPNYHQVPTIWAATWQNQQNECAPSEYWDRPGHLPSLIRVLAVRMKKPWVLSYPMSAQRRMIRLGGCPDWSEYSLDAHSFCWFCHVVAHICFSGPTLTISIKVSTTTVVTKFMGRMSRPSKSMIYINEQTS